jgi:hypothetical protein
VASTVVETGQQAQASSSKTRIVTPEEFNNISQASGSVASDSKKTRFIAPEAQSNAIAVAPLAHGPLAGFLVTFSWDPSGLYFPVREGKTTFGSDPSCDGVISKDRAISGKHFAVMIRKGVVKVRDLDSTNATQVDGQEVWGDSRPATHGSFVKAGDTRFMLVMIPSGAGQSEALGTQDDSYDE